VGHINLAGMMLVVSIHRMICFLVIQSWLGFFGGASFLGCSPGFPINRSSCGGSPGSPGCIVQLQEGILLCFSFTLLWFFPSFGLVSWVLHLLEQGMLMGVLLLTLCPPPVLGGGGYRCWRKRTAQSKVIISIPPPH
jgi:hypothetical protein